MIPIDTIVCTALRFMGVGEAELRGTSRMATVVRTRRIIAHLARKHTALSYPQITKAVYADDRDHTSVVTQIGHYDRDVDEVFEFGGEPTTLRAIVARIEREWAKGSE